MSNTDDLKRLSEKYGMTGGHFHKDPRGFVIMTRRGVEYLQAKIRAVVTFEPVHQWSDPLEGRYCLKAYAKCEMGQIETYGEVSNKNNRNAYPIAMAEKRALSRAILKLAGFYEIGVYGEDEIES
tara:strand:- start:118 stop:492 length:375 start_codon:yes stop_codon:yes gene_type:complete